MTLSLSLCCFAFFLAAFVTGTFPHSTKEGKNQFTVNTPAEKRTSCRKEQFKCNSGLCVDLFLLCDGARDCDDGSDETQEICGDFRCTGYDFQCKYGACIDIDSKCNGKTDCADGSDESYEICRNVETSPTLIVSSTTRGKRLIRASDRWNSSDCGKFVQNPIALEGNRSTEGVALPWYTRIYKKIGGTYQFVGGGTIVSPNAIISVAHIFWNDVRSKMEEPSSFKITVGRYGKRNTSGKDFKVKDVHIPEKYKGFIGNYAYDISVVILEDEIELNDRVYPICIDLENTYSEFLIPGKRGIVGGWDGDPDGDVLRIHVLPFINAVECEENVPPNFAVFLTFDKFCAGLLNVPTVCKGDSGGGYATQFRDRKWYLSGILSVGVQEEGCIHKFYFGYTRVPEYIDFIKKYVFLDDSGDPTHPPPAEGAPTTSKLPNRPSITPPRTTKRPITPIPTTSELPSRPPVTAPTPIFSTTTHHPPPPTFPEQRQCVLPQQPENGLYTILGCSTLYNSAQPGNAISACSALNFSCKAGYVMQGSPISLCSEGWSSPPPVCSTVMCTPLEDSTREIDCILNGEDIDCTSPMLPGSKASVRCKIHYENVPSLTTYDMICQRDGKWNRQLHSCAPKCGEPNPQGVTLIGSGERAKRSEYPWHIGLYKYTKSGLLEIHCGGTIVSSRVIVTASHCFPEDTAKNLQNVLLQYKAVAGKYHRDWNKTSKYTQHLEIETVILHPRYKGSSRNFVNDIAVLILKYQIRVDEAVKPVCVDFDKSFFKYFTPGIKGNVLGWGLTEKQAWSDVLLTATLPYVSQIECEENTPSSFHDFLIGDKFCAGNDKTVVCQGDSGGGYTVQFPRTRRWYLAGVVSIGATEECAIYPYAAFTNIYHHLEFIRNFVYQYI